MIGHSPLGSAPLGADPGAGAGTYNMLAFDGAFVLSMAGFPAEHHILDIDAGVFSYSGAASTLLDGYPLGIDAGAFTLTGIDVTMSRPVREMQAGTGVFGYTVTATPSQAQILHAATGVFTLTGSVGNIVTGFSFPALTGAFNLNGQAASFHSARKMPFPEGDFVLTGKAASTKAFRKMPRAAGTYVLVGSDTSYELGEQMKAAAGTFALTGSAASLKVYRSLQPDVTAYDLEGAVHRLYVIRNLYPRVGNLNLNITGQGIWDHVLPSAAGALHLSGAVAAQVERTLHLSPGSLTLGGTVQAAHVNRRLPVATGAFALAGLPVGLHRRLIPLAASAGHLTLNGQDVVFKRPRRELVAATGTFVLQASSAKMVSSGDFGGLFNEPRWVVMSFVMSEGEYQLSGLERIEGYIEVDAS
jgi:hypothetical protein